MASRRYGSPSARPSGRRGSRSPLSPVSQVPFFLFSFSDSEKTFLEGKRGRGTGARAGRRGDPGRGSLWALRPARFPRRLPAARWACRASLDAPSRPAARREKRRKRRREFFEWEDGGGVAEPVVRAL